MNNVNEIVKAFRELDRKIQSYNESISLMFWDLRTHAPKNAVEGRSEAISLLSTESFKLSISDEMGQLIDKLTDANVFDQLDPIDQKLVEERKKEYEKSKKIPTDLYQAYVKLTAKAESVWEEAKEASDFPMFQPYLEEIVDFNRKFAEIWGYKDHPYNALLNEFEPGMTVDTLDRVFAEVRERIVPLVAKISESANKPDTSFLQQKFDVDQQYKLSEFILKQMGYDFAGGRIDKTMHPFEITLNLGDVRVTTNFKEDDFTFSFFSTVHEGGHALYEQNISPDLAGTYLCTGTSMAIHESQSRFWENKVALSYEFWERYYDELKKTFPGTFDDVPLPDFYRAINAAQPSLIRIEADELTYNLHIMIRYELEKALISGELKVADLPKAWNAKYEEYLGISAEKDSEGVLQDVHWAGGDFGYFPSYALGNMYAAQIMHVMKQQLPQFAEYVRQGKFAPIKDWLTDKVYRHGKMRSPNELIQDITGESLDSSYLSNYLEDKFSKIYDL